MKERKRTHAWTVATLGILLTICNGAFGQQTTTTDCTQNGNNTNCTSNTTDYSAQQQQSYEAGQKIGNALGTGIAAAMQGHSFNKGLKKYCAEHPGEVWHYGSKRDGTVISSGRCPSNEDVAVAAANKFMSKHSKFIPCPENSKK